MKLAMRPSLDQWLADFLSKAHQATRFRSATSFPQPLTCGAPQGTKMRSLYFLILISGALLETNLLCKYNDASTIEADLETTNPGLSQLQNSIN